MLTGVLSPEQAHAGRTPEGTFAGKRLAVDFGSVRIPHVDIPATLEIAADPGNDTHFPVSATFRYEGEGKLIPLGSTSPAQFAPVRSAAAKDPIGGSTLPVTAMSLTYFFSRLREVTDQAMAIAAENKNANFPTTKADFDDLLRAGTSVNVLSDPPVAGGKPSFAVEAVKPAARLTIFELRADAPKMIGVLWPDALARKNATATDPVPYLVYLHPNTAQNFPQHYAGPYPFSHDFPYYQIVRYVLYGQAFEAVVPDVELDPLLHDPYWKGAAHQIAAAGKDVVFVKPVSKPGPEIGAIMDAAAMDMVLREIGAIMFRLAGVYPETPPPIGRVALSSFSASTSLAIQFLRKNAGHDFVRDKLQEIYSFDAPGAFRNAWFTEVGKWIDGEKMARSYGQANAVALFAGLLGAGVTVPATSPHFASSADGRRTCASVAIKDWQAVTPMTVGFQEAHQLVSAMLLTDALRRSGF
jgi:hypothetical protein